VVPGARQLPDPGLLGVHAAAPAGAQALRRPDPLLLAEDDPYGWPVTEYEEVFTLRPGLRHVARQIHQKIIKLGRGEPKHHLGDDLLADNLCWPPELARRAAGLAHERHVLLLPVALSRTDDDRGRVGWTLFGGSEQGPARAFWKAFWTAPGQPLPDGQALAFFRRLLGTVYGEPEERLGNLREAGLRVLAPEKGRDSRGHGELPAWADPLVWSAGHSLRGVRYLLAFRPFADLPAAVRRAYLAGELCLLPCPASLLFWHAPGYLRLAKELPLALQIPLRMVVGRHKGPHGVRVPKAGWMHEPSAETLAAGRPPKKERTTFRRYRHRSARGADEDPGEEAPLAHALFGSSSDAVGLYHKPQARNVQLWTDDFRLLLDGPNSGHDELLRASRAVAEGGNFGYRFQYPAMRVGRHELYWHRLLVAYAAPGSGETAVLWNGPSGYLTAYHADRPDLRHALELWPRLLARDLHVANIQLFRHLREEHPHQTLLNVQKLLDTWPLLVGGAPLPRPFARSLLTLPKDHTLNGWLDSLPELTTERRRAKWLADERRDGLEPGEESPPARPRRPRGLTFRHTARRPFEVAFWKTVAFLSAGEFRNKNNADCVLDPATRAALRHHRRDLEPLGAHLLDYYTGLIQSRGMAGRALAGELPFVWRTDFDYPWMGGWADNQTGRTHERDLLVVIPGRDRRRAVLMADHYDTAYCSDRFDKQEGGDGARIAAPGADDNAAATAALMLGARAFLDLSRRGKLGCDVWLVHLTGEEFPAESLGARHLARCLVEGRLELQLPGGKRRDLSGVRVQGVYVLDLIAHNVRKERDVFQISPGAGPLAMWLAYQAHLANEAWNAAVPAWNRRWRRGLGRGRRSRNPRKVPPAAAFLALDGQVRPAYDPRSTLYNADARVFSDAGVPAVLLMENYDINRSGYHDTKDTVGNINLDYGAAVAAIAIEAVARAATEEPPR
jgi:hypothetical protein